MPTRVTTLVTTHPHPLYTPNHPCLAEIGPPTQKGDRTRQDPDHKTVQWGSHWKLVKTYLPQWRKIFPPNITVIQGIGSGSSLAWDAQIHQTIKLLISYWNNNTCEHASAWFLLTMSTSLKKHSKSDFIFILQKRLCSFHPDPFKQLVINFAKITVFGGSQKLL